VVKEQNGNKEFPIATGVVDYLKGGGGVGGPVGGRGIDCSIDRFTWGRHRNEIFLS